MQSNDKIFSSAKVTEKTFTDRKYPQEIIADTYTEYVIDKINQGQGGIIVYGPSKCGKTSLIEKSFSISGRDPITIQGRDITSVGKFWDIIFNNLGYGPGKEYTYEIGDSGEFSGNVGVSGGFGGKFSAKRGKMKKSTLRVNHSLSDHEEIRNKLKDSGRAVIVDDFHNVQKSVRKEIALQLKPIIRHNLVILIAIPLASFETIDAVPDLASRLELLEIPRWSSDELIGIGSKGFSYAGYEEHTSKLISKTAAENSFGSPHLMQEICYYILSYIRRKNINGDETFHKVNDCMEDVLHTVVKKVKPAVFDSLIRGKVNSKRKIYQVNLPKRFKRSGGVSLDSYGIALSSLSEFCIKGSVSVSMGEISNKISSWDIRDDRGSVSRPSVQQIAVAAKGIADLAYRDKGEFDPVVAYKQASTGQAGDVLEVIDPALSLYLCFGDWVKDKSV